MDTKKFRLVAISQNTNSFGLHGFIWLAKDGESYEVGGNHMKHALYKQRLDDARFEGFPEIEVPVGPNRVPTFDGFEIPKQLPKPHDAVIAEVWEAA